MLAPGLLALLAIPAGAALLRTLSMAGSRRWCRSAGDDHNPLLGGCTSGIMLDIGPILLLSAVVVRLSREPEPDGRWVALQGVRVRFARKSWVVAGDCLRRRADRPWFVAFRRRDDEPGSWWGCLSGAAGFTVSMLFMFGVQAGTLVATGPR